MATILESNAVCDGWDVRISTAGRKHMLHFSSEPTQQQLDDVITAFEQRLLDMATESLGGEEE